MPAPTTPHMKGCTDMATTYHLWLSERAQRELRVCMEQLVVELARGAGLVDDEDDEIGDDVLLHAACLPTSAAAVLDDVCRLVGIAPPAVVLDALGICPPDREATRAA